MIIDKTMPVSKDMLKYLAAKIPAVNTTPTGNNIIVMMPYISEFMGSIRKTDAAIEAEQKSVMTNAVLVLAVSEAISKSDKIPESCKPKPGDFIHCGEPRMTSLLPLVEGHEIKLGLKDPLTGDIITDRLMCGFVDYYSIFDIVKDARNEWRKIYNTQINSIDKSNSHMPPEKLKEREEEMFQIKSELFDRYWKVIQ